MSPKFVGKNTIVLKDAENIQRNPEKSAKSVLLPGKNSDITPAFSRHEILIKYIKNKRTVSVIWIILFYSIF